MKKRVLSMFLMLCMVLTLVPAVAWAEETPTFGKCGEDAYWSFDEATGKLTIGGKGAEIVASGNCGKNGSNVTWTLDSEGALTISGEGEMEDYTWDSDCPPWEKRDPDIKNVVIEDGVVNIGDYAFAACKNLISIQISNGVKTIGDFAFSSCRGLKRIDIPDEITRIGAGAFTACRNLKEIIIPYGVTKIEEAAFSFCNNITSITIPKSVTSIDVCSFDGCTGLKDIYYGSSATEWKKIFIDEGNDVIKTATIHYNSGDTPIEYKITVTSAPSEGGTAVADKITAKPGETVKILFMPNEGWYAGSFSAVGGTPVPISSENGRCEFVMPAMDVTVQVKFERESTNPKIYTTGFQMGVDSLRWNNSKGFYGDNAYYISDEDYNHLLKLLNAWDKHTVKGDLKDYKKEANDPDGNFGLCYGASVVMALMYTKNLSPYEYGGTYNAYSLPKPTESKKVASLLTYYHITQNIVSFWVNDYFESQTYMGQKLIDALMKEKHPVIVNLRGIVVEGGKKGEHSVLAYAVDVDSDANNYIVYIADPNGLYVPYGIEKACYPGGILVNKKDYTLTGVYHNNPISHLKPDEFDKYFHYAGNIKFRSIISDLSVFDPYSIRDGQTFIIEEKEPEFNIITMGYGPYGNLIKITANGKEAIINGDTITGDLEIYETYGSLNGENDDVRAYCVEPADSYTITYSDNSPKTTMVGFSAGTEMGGAVESNADTLVFNSNGTISISNASGESSVTTVTDETYENWYAVKAVTDKSDLTISPQANDCKISSQSDLGNIKVTGISDWNEFELSASTDNSEVTVKEIIEPDDTSYLTINDNSGEELARTAVSYAVIYVTNGGSFVDAVRNMPYGEKIKSPSNPTYEGHTFAGWYKDEECSAGQKWDFNSDTVTEDTVLYAKWTKSNSGGGGGGGGGGSATKPSNKITVAKAENGTVKVSPTNAKQGEMVTITATPGSGYKVDTVVVTDKNSKNLSVKDNGDGTFTFTMPSSEVDVKATFKEDKPAEPINPVPTDPEPQQKGFTDVPANAWYRSAVDYVVSKGIMSGMTDTTFEPNTDLSRAMLVAVLYRLEGSPKSDAANPFNDVEDGKWYTDPIIWASEKGIVSGYGEGKFGPTDKITREQMASILMRYAEFKGFDASKRADLDKYEDANEIGSWAVDSMRWANAEGIITGHSVTTLVPKGNTTRAETALIFMRFIEKIAE